MEIANFSTVKVCQKIELVKVFFGTTAIPSAINGFVLTGRVSHEHLCHQLLTTPNQSRFNICYMVTTLLPKGRWRVKLQPSATDNTL